MGWDSSPSFNTIWGMVLVTFSIQASNKAQKGEAKRYKIYTFSLKLTASLHLKIGLNAPKGNEKVFQPSIFKCYVCFREGRYWFHSFRCSPLFGEDSDSHFDEHMQKWLELARPSHKVRG